MNDTNNTNQLGDINQLLEHFNNGVLNLKAKHLVWLSMNDKKLLSNELIKNGSNTYNIIRDSLFIACMLDIANLGRDNDNRSLSLINIMNFFKNNEKKIKEKLLEDIKNFKSAPSVQGSIPPESDIQRFDKNHRAEKINELNNNFAMFHSMYEDKSMQGKLSSFWIFRNKVAAHQDIYDKKGNLREFDISNLNLKYDDLTIAIEYLLDINKLLHQILKNKILYYDDLNKEVSDNANQFWQPFFNIPLHYAEQRNQ